MQWVNLLRPESWLLNNLNVHKSIEQDVDSYLHSNETCVAPQTPACTQ